MHSDLISIEVLADAANIKDKKLLHFVNYLVASTDYPSFYKIMVRAAKKAKKAESKSEGKSDDTRAADQNVDSKDSNRGDAKDHK